MNDNFDYRLDPDFQLGIPTIEEPEDICPICQEEIDGSFVDNEYDLKCHWDCLSNLGTLKALELVGLDLGEILDMIGWLKTK